MYPSTTFIIEDRSQIDALAINEQVNAPLFLQAFSSDKGPEEMGVYYGEEFAKTFGTPNFARHGQPLLQAQTLINNGARVLAKRIVAPDSTLANLIVVAKVKTESTQKKNEAGEPLYKTPEGVETTVAEGNEAILVSTCNINYELQTITDNSNDVVSLYSSAAALASYEGKTADEEKVYPLFVIADNGRGISSKKFKITANVTGSRNRAYLTYVFSVIENSAVTESTLFALNPEVSTATSNLSLTSVSKTYLTSVRAFSIDDCIVDFLAAVKEATGIENMDNCDVLFGKTKSGVALENVVVGTDVNLAIPTGLALQSGSNGSFGNFPMKSEFYNVALIEFFNGTFTDNIYDVDNILLDGIIDANYDIDVKSAIESLVEFREDCFYFRDLGVGLHTAEDIIFTADAAAKSRYVAVYGNSYDVIDPYSKRQVTVTVGYSLARLLPKHFSEKRHAPLAGHLHGFIFDEIVEGTLNFAPKVIPGKNQKEELFAKHINFISYMDNVPVMESEYTSQGDYTGFSFINNTLAVQEVVKAIRVRCPKSRYTFMEEDDLTKYEEDIQALLNNYTSRFGSLEFEYAADETYEQNMTFYAILKVRFKKFIQAEVFRIIAINGEDYAAI